MPEINESQIKLALSAVEDVHPKYSIRQADLSERAHILTNQRAVENLLASFLTKAGFEFDKFDKIRTQNQTELRRMVEKQNAEALKHSSSVKDTLRYGVDSRRKTFEYLATLTPPLAPATYEQLATPSFIWPTLGLSLDASHIEPGNSWAKFKLEAQSPPPSWGTEKLRFCFQWENPSDSPAVINVTSVLGLNGFCDAQAGPGTFPDPERYASLDLRANLRLYEWWHDPPTQPLWQDNQEQLALPLFADATGWFAWEGGFAAAPVNRGYVLDYTMFMIPPHGAVIFAVGVEIAYSISQILGDDGNIHVDFTNGDREVACYGVWIHILT